VQSRLSETKLNKRCILAAVFLILLIVEWGSHALAYASHPSNEGQAISASEEDHQDPCKTLILCSDSGRKDQQTPNLGHDVSQHNAFFARPSNSRRLAGFRFEPDMPLETVNRILRPPDPQFHPPELS